jgi:hypothetical protein
MRRTIGVFCAAVCLFASSSNVAQAVGATRGGALPGQAPNANCSTPLKLRDGPNQSGTTVSVSVRGLWVNLSDVGFNNRTSSYTVGACAVELAAQANGGGNHYTRCLYAGCVENTMLPGWDNVISSVYLH